MNDIIPDGLRDWIIKRCGDKYTIVKCKWPIDDLPKGYVLCSCPLNELNFDDHLYNPRNSSITKVRKLKASIQLMGLFSPLTCAFVEKHLDKVLLIDGRHRYDALLMIKEKYPEWAEQVYIDIKIYYNLPPSDLHAMATYLNKTRQKLKKGEYYRALVKIYNRKKEEIEENEGETPTEQYIIENIHGEEYSNKTVDFTTGRIVGLIAFDKNEEGSWYPFIGLGQREKIPLDEYNKLVSELNLHGLKSIYKPLTAGSFHDFIRPLCYDKPYPDWGKRRSVEIGNVSEMGVIFRDIFFQRELFDIPQNKQYTATTIGCRYWCIVALGQLMNEIKGHLLNENEKNDPLMAHEYPNWNEIKGIFEGYKKSMDIQAQYVKKYIEKKRAEKSGQEEILEKAWSYRTTKEKVMAPLRDELREMGYPFKERR